MKPAAASNNAMLEGGNPADEESANKVPVSEAELFDRLDAELRLRDAALIRTPKPRTSPVEPPAYWYWEAALRIGGRVVAVDLAKRAVELGVLDVSIETLV